MQAAINDYAVYENDTEYLGHASFDMPDVVNKTVTVNGAGIPGDVEVPMIGHTDAMNCTIKFIDNPRAAHVLSEQRMHQLTLMVAHQILDPVTQLVTVERVKHVLKVMPKNRTGGTIAPASAQGVTTEFACFYRADYVNDEQVFLIDKLTNRYIDTSGDKLAEVNNALGRPSTSQI